MDRTVPRGAAYLLDFIGSIEAPRGYDTIYGNNQDKIAKPITKMTIRELLEAQRDFTARFKSSASGKYQIMRDTLLDLVKELGLGMNQKFDPNLQDRLAYHLLRRRGYDAFVFGRIDIVEYGKRLAQEWASFPVLAGTRGQHRNVKRGQSYYTGDALNKALVGPERIELALKKVLALHAESPAAPQVKPSKTGQVATGAAAAGAAAAVVVAEPAGTLKGISDTAEALKPVSEALSGLAAIPVSVLLVGGAVFVIGFAAWWIIKGRSKDAEHGEDQ